MTINVREFVKNNIKQYNWDKSFLSWPSKKTKKLWKECLELLEKEKNNWWCLSVDNETISTITSHKPWYINKELEVIVWLQTDKPLKRAIKPFWWVRVVEWALVDKWYKLTDRVKDIFKYTQNHNDAVFSVYDSESRLYRKNHIITWLPDNYARWRIIWDYRRLALYGINKIIEEKKIDFWNIKDPLNDNSIRLREEISKQVEALNEIKDMAKSYWFDVSNPAKNAKEAIQWIYFAYLAAVKEQDWAAMSLWNVSSFIDIYIEKDLENWIIDEEQAQELIDNFVIKLRFVRQLRPKAYDEIFWWDPTWVTESIWWMWNDWKIKVTKTSFRFLQTLYNLGPSPEPNLTVLWSNNMPINFKKFCSEISINTSSIQYENDDLMRECRWWDDYGIACCVSYQEIWKKIQHFWARCNLPKALLMSINWWKEEINWNLIIKNIPEIESDKLEYNEVMKNFKLTLWELARVYAKTMYCIHYMHDKYYYEKAQMAFIDSDYLVDIAYWAAWISIIADSLSAIKYAKVIALRDENWIAKEFKIEWDFPKYWNDDDRVDNIAKEISNLFNNELKKHKAYKDANPTLSLLTITSNVMYWKSTGETPDWRQSWIAFAPWANPMHWRDLKWAIASLNSVAKLDYSDSVDWISNTFSIIPNSLWLDETEQIENLVDILDWYFSKKAHHLNVNVLNKETLIDAYNNPEKYPQLTIRVSWYAVNFVKLSKEHQKEVIERTFHDKF